MMLSTWLTCERRLSSDLPVRLVPARQLSGQRVLVAAVDAQFVIEMRTGGIAGGTDIGDDLALGNALTDVQVRWRRGNMGIGGLVAAVMANADIFAVARFQEIFSTMPSPAAMMELPIGARKSTPLWNFRTPRIGWMRQANPSPSLPFGTGR